MHLWHTHTDCIHTSYMTGIKLSAYLPLSYSGNVFFLLLLCAKQNEMCVHDSILSRIFTFYFLIHIFTLHLAIWQAVITTFTSKSRVQYNVTTDSAADVTANSVWTIKNYFYELNVAQTLAQNILLLSKRCAQMDVIKVDMYIINTITVGWLYSSHFHSTYRTGIGSRYSSHWLWHQIALGRLNMLFAGTPRG